MLRSSWSWIILQFANQTLANQTRNTNICFALLLQLYSIYCMIDPKIKASCYYSTHKHMFCFTATNGYLWYAFDWIMCVLWLLKTCIIYLFSKDSHYITKLCRLDNKIGDPFHTLLSTISNHLTPHHFYI